VFKIVDFQKISGKIRMTIETEELDASIFLQFFDKVSEFAQLYRYRVTAQSKLDLSQKNRPEKMELAYRKYREELTRFRELKGTPIERIRILKNLRAAQGEDVTLDGIMAELKIAREEERNDKLNNIVHLSRKGYPLDKIASELKIPRSTVSRYLKKVPTERKKDNIPIPAAILPFRKGKT